MIIWRIGQSTTRCTIVNSIMVVLVQNFHIGMTSAQMVASGCHRINFPKISFALNPSQDIDPYQNQVEIGELTPRYHLHIFALKPSSQKRIASRHLASQENHGPGRAPFGTLPHREPVPSSTASLDSRAARESQVKRPSASESPRRRRLPYPRARGDGAMADGKGGGEDSCSCRVVLM